MTERCKTGEREREMDEMRTTQKKPTFRAKKLSSHSVSSSGGITMSKFKAVFVRPEETIGLNAEVAPAVKRNAKRVVERFILLLYLTCAVSD
jgi:hypothetical protein